ncbi:MAG: c-type cytochrome domain-containing protein, partial [Planctomycetaceae bacterium]
MRKTPMNRWNILLLAIAAVFARTARAEVDYQKQVRPVLAEHCWQCHGVDAQERQGGLRLDDRVSAVQGGESGVPAIVPGNPDA